MMLPERWCVKFLVPLKYNDGNDIEPEKFNQVREELLEKFGGFSIFPFSIEGGWVDAEENTKYFDRTKSFEVTMDQTPENEIFLREFKQKLKDMFNQHEIYMVIFTVYKV